MQYHMSRPVASILLVTLFCAVQPLPAWTPGPADSAEPDQEALASAVLLDACARFMSLPPSPREEWTRLVEEEVLRYGPLFRDGLLAGSGGGGSFEESLRATFLAGLEERINREERALLVANLGRELSVERTLLDERFEGGEIDREAWFTLLREAGRTAVLRQLGQSDNADTGFEEELFSRAGAWIAREALAARLADADRYVDQETLEDRRNLLSHDLSIASSGPEASGDVRSLMEDFDRSVGTLQADLLSHLQAAVAVDMGDGSRLSNEGDDWMSRWNGDLDRALATWEGAATRFLARRVDWEEDASRSFMSAQEAWSEAWTLLEACRDTWEQDLESLYTGGVTNYQADVLAVNTALDQLLARMSSLRTALVAQEERAAAAYLEASRGGAVYAEGLESGIRSILYEAGDHRALLLSQEELAAYDSSSLSLSVAKKGQLDALMASLNESLEERGTLEDLLAALSTEAPGDNPGLLVGDMVLDSLASWASQREAGALALVAYRDRVAGGEIARGQDLPAEGTPGYAEILLWAGSPALDTDWPDEVLADARFFVQRASNLASSWNENPDAPESVVFETVLSGFSAKLEELEGLQALAGHWERTQDLAARDFEAAQEDLNAACAQWTLPEKLPSLYRDTAGRLRLFGEGACIDAPDSISEDLISWVRRMDERNFDNECLLDWALARAYVISCFEEGPITGLKVGEATWLGNTVGQLVVDDVSIISVMNAYRSDTRQSLMEESWSLMDEETRADIEFLALLELGSNPIADALNGALCTIMEEMEFAMVDACISARIEAAESVVQNCANGTALMMGFTILNIFNPLGWFCGGMMALTAGAAVVNSIEIETLHNSRCSYEDEWARIVEEREKGVDLFSQAFCELGSLIDKYETLNEKRLFAEDPENAQVLWANFANALAEDGSAPVVPALREHLVNRVASIFEGGVGSDNSVLLPMEALDSALETTALDVSVLVSQLDSLVGQRYEQDVALAEALAAGAMDWICGTVAAVDPRPYIKALLHENSRVSEGQISRYKDLRATLASCNAGGSPSSPTFHLPLETLLSSVARTSLLQEDSLVALERIRARTELSRLEAAQLLFCASLDAITASGSAAIAEAEESLEEICGDWEQSCAQALEAGTAAWEGAWQQHLELREVWLEDCARSWQDGLSRTALSLLAESGCREARSLDTLLVVPALMSPDVKSADLASLMDGLRAELVLPIASQALYGLSLETSLPSLGDKEAGVIDSLLSRTLDASRAASSSLAARNRRDLLALNEFASLSALEAMVDAFTANLIAVNNDFDASMDELFVVENKWQRSGGRYLKDYVVHATLVDSLLYKSSEVSVYTPLLPADCGYEGIESVYAREDRALAIEEAYATVEELFDRVFGTEEEDGLLAEHIGTAPQREIAGESEADAPLDTKGSGELGRLVGACLAVMREEGEGWAKAAVAWYDKPIANDRSGAFSWLKSCSVRTIADIVVSIAAGASTAGLGTVAAQLATAAISLGDDIIFSLADLERGNDAGSVLLNLGKKAFMSVTSPAIGGGFGALSQTALESARGLVGVTMNFAMDATRILTTNVVNAAISAVQWDGSSLGWSQEAFGSALDSGFPAAMAGSFVTAGLNGGLEGLTGELLENARGLSSFAGGLVGEAVRYQTEGTMSFNILDAADLSGGALNGDLLRLDIGDKGASVQLGAGGASAGFSTLYPALKGLEAWGLNARLLVDGGNDLSRYQSALRTLYSGAPGMRAEFEALLAGAVEIREDWTLDATAESVFVEEEGIKLITLGREALEDRSRFGLNLVLAHESRRNGIVDDEYTQRLETANAVYTQLSTAGALAAAWGAGSLSFEQQEHLDTLLRAHAGDWHDYARLVESFDSSGDYWKIVANRDAEGNVVSYAAIWDEQTCLDLSDLGLGSVDLETLDEESLNTLVADLEEQGVNLDGRALTAGDMEAIRAVNTALMNFESSLTTANRNQFMAALEALQNRGIISGNGRSYVNEGIASVGEGTYASPHAPIIGTLVETTASGHRLTMLGLQPETGGGPGRLTSYNHVGADYRLRQDPLGQYFAMFGGTLSLEPEHGDRGFSLTITDPSGNKQLVAHNSADTLWAFMNLWGSTAANLDNRTLSGVPAASLIGSYGPTGNTTGAHLHMEVKNAAGKNMDPSDYLNAAGYSISTAGPVVPVYSGYKVPGGEKAENREAYVQSEAFAEQFFGQAACFLPRSFRDEMLVVMRANKLFTSPGFAALSPDVVLPYLREWYPGASSDEQRIMVEIARQHNPGGYKQWENLPLVMRRHVLP